jgi:predicted transcriptional regulator
VVELGGNFTENDYKIMKAILDKNDKQKGLRRNKATTIEEIQGKTNLSSTKIRNTLNSFIQHGFVCEGIKQGRTKTYMMTEEGLIELNSLRMNIFGKVE